MDSLQRQGEKGNKRTRDLPNLSECHSCGFRIDSCDGKKNRLQTLYSEWRIVLLCKICFVRVESSHLCSYCFKGSSSDNCFHCRHCKRIIHQSCFSDFATVAPWSFSSQFSVCIDCWVPKSIASKRACHRSNRNHNSKCNLLEDVVKDANCDAQKKVEAAARARELAVEKALAARKAAELAYSALDLVSERDGNGIAAVDDVQVASHLRRVLKCSSQFLNNLCSVSSAGSNMLVRGCICRKLDVSHGKTVADPSALVRVSCHGSSLNMDSLGTNGIDDHWVRQSAKDPEIRPKEGEESSSDRLMNSESQSRKGGDGFQVHADVKYNGKPDRFSLKYTRRSSADARYDRKPDSYLRKYARRSSADERYNVKLDPYLRKYARRTSACERYNEKLDRCLRKYTRRKPKEERFNVKPNRYSIKYTRRRLNQESILDSSSNCLYERLNHETQAFAVALTLSCSKESETFFSTSPEVCHFSLQSSACSSDLFETSLTDTQ